MISISDKDFDQFMKFVYDKYGINLTGKKTLVEGRLTNTITQRGLSSFEEYFKIVQNDKTGLEATNLLNKITTNHTYFLRENQHFEYMTNTVLPFLEKKHSQDKVLRIWSAGCSSGQEPYTIAMCIAEYFGTRKLAWDTTILCTDISENAMDKARQGIYKAEDIKDVPPSWVAKYFKDRRDGTYEIVKKVKDELIFRKLNLMDRFSFPNPFDLIFCRNVMIYFDSDTKDKLVQKFYNVTANNGYLFIGHSEVINKASVGYTFIKSAIYQKRS